MVKPDTLSFTGSETFNGVHYEFDRPLNPNTSLFF
ncbi:hypothetical protein AsAng_0043090 [Aureispira anguillae]|uniref:Uncharacterized protein n=1 Tax=Aureispira anguillae TaxID=2864201 RepID=A0A916DVH3_9BACT|nr:hypothetical protein AsAng_0043090 [Aureispira anguillae]